MRYVHQNRCIEEKVLEFYEQVHEIVRMVPRGRVTTYGAVARALGMIRSSRLVGTAMILAHGPELDVPAHRVVNKIGLLSGKHHYDTPTHMQELLEADGIVIVDDQVQDFDKVFWDPLAEI